MTANQIAFQKLKEDERNHRANEAIGQATQREQMRSNLAQEQLKAQYQNNQNWYNQQQIALTSKNLEEQARHNLATEKQSRLATLLQRQTEQQQLQQQAQLTSAQQKIDAEYKRRSASTSEAQQREQARSNLANELIKQQQIGEASRHNIASEGLTLRQLEMNRSISQLDRASRERIAAANNATSISTATIQAFSRLTSSAGSRSGISKLAKLMQGGS